MALMGSLYLRGKTYWFKFRDFSGVTRRIRAAQGKRAAQTFIGHVHKLNECALVGNAPEGETLEWLSRQKPEIVQRFVDWRLISAKALVARESLDSQLDRWHAGIVARGRASRYADARKSCAQRLITKSGAEHWHAIDAESVLETLMDWRRENKIPGVDMDRDVSENTLAHYLSAAKAFTRWMRKSGYAGSDPLLPCRIHRDPKRAKLDRPSVASQRRALTIDEQKALVTGVLKLRVRYGVSAAERSLIYRVALQTGLRPVHIHSLTVDSLIDSSYLVPRAQAYNKRCSEKPLKPELGRDLAKFAEGRDAGKQLLPMPHKNHRANMIREDCVALGIDTHGIDFYSLRHTFASTLASQGVHPKLLADLMDDSVAVVMKFYTHTLMQDQRQAIENLPDAGFGAKQGAGGTKIG